MIGVSTSEELKDVLENENEYEFIYLMADITLSSGIKINEKKPPTKFLTCPLLNNNNETITSIIPKVTINTQKYSKGNTFIKYINPLNKILNITKNITKYFLKLKTFLLLLFLLITTSI